MRAHPPISLHVEGPLAVATLSRPPVNAIDEAWIACLDEALDALARAAGVAALLLRSTERIFCAGADLELMRSRFDTPDGRARFVAFVREIQRVYARIEGLPQVTIAQIGGAALGGGFELALACDLRIAADDAKLGLPEARLGLLPGAGGTQRLTRIAGAATAKRLILGAEVVSGAQASALGLVHWSAPAADLAARTDAIVRNVTALPSAALAACKRCIHGALEPGMGGYELELEGTAALLANEVTQEKVRAFLEKKR
jgi:enoyl-CoA hydratase/carnithine racemase